MKNPLIVAHRGATQLAPENSLAAFFIAIEKGADAIEFDIHLSKDNQIVVHHDYYLGRTENGAGFIGDYSLAALQIFNIGAKFSDSFSNEQMPTFRDVLDIGKGRVRFEIELRCPTLSFLNSVIGEINRADMINDVEITSPHTPLLIHVKNINPKIRTGVFFSSFPSWMTTKLGQQHIVDWMVLLNAQVVHLPFALLNKDFIDVLHHKDFIVHGSDLNSENEIGKAIHLGINQFSTDVLETAIEVRDILRERK